MATKVIKEGGSAFYGIGMIGAFVYYMQNASSAVEVLLGIIKSILWPAFFVHRMFEYLRM